MTVHPRCGTAPRCRAPRCCWAPPSRASRWPALRLAPSWRCASARCRPTACPPASRSASRRSRRRRRWWRSAWAGRRPRCRHASACASRSAPAAGPCWRRRGPPPAPLSAWPAPAWSCRWATQEASAWRPRAPRWHSRPPSTCPRRSSPRRCAPALPAAPWRWTASAAPSPCAASTTVGAAAWSRPAACRWRAARRRATSWAPAWLAPRGPATL
mmetsp:Transcript_43448/g.112507  ORF Transcript_43448/g.112507 Transcript_43448/m.112507 type:complete len:214 (-) Transcript_43448:486-1127(-)